MIANCGRMKNPTDRTEKVGDIQKVNKGQSGNFQFNYIVPQDINNYTAIGRVAARYFMLELSLGLGCCTSNSSVPLHLVLNSKLPKVITQEKIAPPVGWNPFTFEKVSWMNMKPFNYAPLPGIPFKNRGNMAKMGMNN